MSAVLQIENLAKSFAGPGGLVRALDGVSLTIEPGEFVVVQGPSGSGKTTLLLGAGSLRQPTGGQVFIQGQNPYHLSPEARARFRAANVGFVFQQFHLIPYLSVLDNVLTPSLALPSAEAPMLARELLAQFGLRERIHHVPAELSTGERQRTALARALLNRPKLLLADEPTGNLDRDNAALVLASLRDFAARGGAVLLVTHDLSAEPFARRTLRLKSGKLVEAKAA